MGDGTFDDLDDVEWDHLVVRDGEGNELKSFDADDVRVETEPQVAERTRRLREQAPRPEKLTDGDTADIDEVIWALEVAKERGVERVKVNDNDRSRPCKPTVTNNYWGYSPITEPRQFWEWVEL